MKFFTSHWQIFAASFLSLMLVFGAYTIAKNGAHPTLAEASTQTELLKAIASTDGDGDGLPDWEETLYGTDPHNPDTRGLGMTDGDAVEKGLIVPKAVARLPDAPLASSTPTSGSPAGAAPGTLTDAFARTFFTLYLNAKTQAGGALSKAQLSALTQEALAVLQKTITTSPDFRIAGQLTIAGSGPDALRAYAAAAESVFGIHSARLPKSEIDYLLEATKGDAAALDAIAAIAKSYSNAAAGLAALSVPQEAAAAHLRLVNAAARLGEIQSDFTKLKTDPLVTMLALNQYPDAAQALGLAFTDIAQVYARANIVLTPGTPGASFVNIIKDLSTPTTP